VTRVALLDVNVLVALFDPDHIHHDLAHDWFADQRPHGWATCPLTENGLIRVLSSPGYSTTPLRAAEMLERLGAFRASGQHRFWPAAISFADARLFNPALVSGHRQVTDIYLLGLAKQASGALATFDRSIPLAAVKGATRAHLQLIAPGAD
jgi:uncharacterized protein